MSNVSVYMVLILCATLHITEATGCEIPAFQQISTYIYDGITAAPNSWPWQVYLDFPTSFCGGSIISRRWIVTAARCVANEAKGTIIVKAGAHDLDKQENSRIDYYVDEIHIYPGYNDVDDEDDIALLKVSQNISFSDRIRPVCLPDKDVPVGTICTAVGWGYYDNLGPGPSSLLQSKMTIKDASHCISELGHIHKFDDGKMICADGFMDTCKGDSGGGLICRENIVYYLQGITSWGKDTCGDGPDAFVRVTNYKSWIEGIVNAGAIIGVGYYFYLLLAPCLVLLLVST